jgi:hypothetical protein
MLFFGGQSRTPHPATRTSKSKMKHQRQVSKYLSHKELRQLPTAIILKKSSDVAYWH